MPNKMRILIAALIVTVILISFAPTSAKPEPADTVFKNGNFYTVDERQPRAEAVAVKAGKIIYVGSNKDVKAFEGNDTRIVDLKGSTVVPGLTDSHYHLSGVGAREMNLNLEGADSLEAFLAKVKERVNNTKSGEWVTGRGWIETFWKPQAFPTRWDLDKISPENPVYLTRADGHASIANSAALKAAGIDKNTPNPFGVEFLKDARTGELHGALTDTAPSSVSWRSR